MQKIFNLLQLGNGIYLICTGTGSGSIVKGMSENAYIVKTDYIFSSCLWH